MSGDGGVREIRGWVTPEGWRLAMEQECDLAIKPDRIAKIRPYLDYGLRVRVTLRAPGEPDGLPVGSMSNKGEVLGYPVRGAAETAWWQQVDRRGACSHGLVSLLKPAPEPKKYAVVVEGFATREEADNYIGWAENFNSARVVDASTLGGSE